MAVDRESPKQTVVPKPPQAPQFRDGIEFAFWKWMDDFWRRAEKGSDGFGDRTLARFQATARAVLPETISDPPTRDEVQAILRFLRNPFDLPPQQQ